ncbi:unnamed protein product [Spirodela intermedia]|uniref:Uncharacterized protein n=1 Tax=Spirodela intermedia TaxID=51605 RepID=A0A7I8I9G3_SPIIN|nr:unnamed protein product [Spirodela intermedia]CAA6654295.1 unnamed protein product [Spirodela intermedia]
MEEGKAAPHGVLLAVCWVWWRGSSIIKERQLLRIHPGDHRAGVLLILPIFLIVLIRVLSSERIKCLPIYSRPLPDSIHRAGWLPVGVGLLLVLILLLLYFGSPHPTACRVDCEDD